MPTQALEHLSEETLEAYNRRSLSSEDRSAVQDHVADCEDCRIRFRQRVYANDDAKAEVGKRLINLLDAVREESLRTEQERDERREAEPQPTFMQQISAAFTARRLGYAFAVMAFAALGVVALTVWRWQSSRKAVQPDEVAKTMTGAQTTPVPASQQSNGNSQQSNANNQTPVNEPPASPPNANDATLGAAFKSQHIKQLPLEARNVVGTLSLQPGVTRPGDVNGNNSQMRGTQASPRPALVGRLNDAGSVIGLDDAGRVVGLESALPSFREAARQALSGDVEVPEKVISDLRGNISDMTRSGAPEDTAERRVMLLEPLGRVVRTDRPTFRWKPFDGSKYYIVKVVTDGFDAVEQSDKLTEPHWTSTRPLTSDTNFYWWQVEAYIEGKESPVISSSKIKVLDPAKERELKAAETQYPNSHLLLGSLYARAGLVDEAEYEFQLLLKANPKSPLAQRLLKSVREKKQPRPSK